MRVVGTLILTHSSRRTEPARCSLGFLTRRFAAPGRLDDPPPFDTLPPAAALYSGAVSFYRLHRARGDHHRGALRLTALGAIQHRDKIQHVRLLGDCDLWLGFEHRLERWRLRAPIEQLRRVRRRDCRPVERIEHPHLAGLHTVEPLADGRLAAACSAPDAVLLIDPESGTVTDTLRLPAARYGSAYPRLTASMDLRRHYIDDALQATHLNAASPSADGRRLAVSSLIPGAIGVFDLDSGGYRELTRGFVGCHGARFDHAGRVYFTDSATGTLVTLGDGGRIVRRFAVRSRWLHDVQQIAGSVYAFALSDRNELRLYDLARGVRLARRRFRRWPLDGLFALARRWPGWRGNSVQALSYTPSGGSSSSASSP